MANILKYVVIVTGMGKEMAKSFIILGVARSGTSLVAKGLNSIIKMGNNFYPANEFNPEGFYEDIDIMALNAEILKEAGGSWRIVPSHEKILEQKDRFAPKIQNLINEKFSGCELFGIKNPFMTLTIDLWLPYLPNPHIIAIFRDPVDVANSIIKMETGDFNEVFELVKIYNARLIGFLQRFYYKNFDV